MSKITVTTIAGQTSGADANLVKIESGDTLQALSNATVGGTLGVTGDLTVDTTTLKVDSSNNRVGIGTSSPSAGLQLEGAANNLASQLKVTASGVVSQYIGGSSSEGLSIGHDHSSLPIVFKTGVNSGTGVTGSGTERMRIDGSGRVTIPNQPSFQARSNVANINLSTYAGATYALTTLFNAEYFDIGNNYNTTTSTFTAPVAGRYYFYTQLQLTASPTTSDHSWGINLHFQVNNAGNHANGYQSLSTNQGGGSTTLFGSYGLAVKENILNLAANDTVRVAISGNANINAGTIESVTNDGRCRFSGHLLG